MRLVSSGSLQNMQIIALTGTMEKLVTHFLARLRGKGFSSGIIGSLGYGEPEKNDTDLTTPMQLDCRVSELFMKKDSNIFLSFPLVFTGPPVRG